MDYIYDFVKTRAQPTEKPTPEPSFARASLRRPRPPRWGPASAVTHARHSGARAPRSRAPARASRASLFCLHAENFVRALSEPPRGLSRRIYITVSPVAVVLMIRGTSNSSSACDERAARATTRALLFATNISSGRSETRAERLTNFIARTQVEKAAPWWIWIVIACATIGISFAGVLLQNELYETPPITRACWRLTLTTFFLAPMGAWEYRRWESSAERDKMRAGKTWGILLGSGFALGVHFAAWVASLDMTSLAHSLLFVTTSPLLILVENAIFRRHRPTNMETAGVLIGLVGAGITLLDIRDDKEVTAKGDALAFLGAVAIVFHIECGRTLRTWMPTTVYAFPVTLIAAVFLALFALVFDEREPVFGWASSAKISWFVLLAFVSGIIGHAGFNFALGYVSSLVVSISTTMEPVVGTIIGFLTYGTSTPKLFTLLGGPLLLAGIVLVIRGGADQSQANGETSDVRASHIAL